MLLCIDEGRERLILATLSQLCTNREKTLSINIKVMEKDLVKTNDGILNDSIARFQLFILLQIFDCLLKLIFKCEISSNLM